MLKQNTSSNNNNNKQNGTEYKQFNHKNKEQNTCLGILSSEPGNKHDYRSEVKRVQHAEHAFRNMCLLTCHVCNFELLWRVQCIVRVKQSVHVTTAIIARQINFQTYQLAISAEHVRSLAISSELPPCRRPCQ